jgi:hypothetical protein
MDWEFRELNVLAGILVGQAADFQEPEKDL